MAKKIDSYIFIKVIGEELTFGLIYGIKAKKQLKCQST